MNTNTDPRNNIKLSKKIINLFVKAYELDVDATTKLSIENLGTKMQMYNSKNHVDCYKCAAASFVLHLIPESGTVDLKMTRCRMLIELKKDTKTFGIEIPDAPMFCTDFCATEDELNAKTKSKE